MTEEEGGKEGGRRLKVAVGLKEGGMAGGRSLKEGKEGVLGPALLETRCKSFSGGLQEGESHQPGSRARD